MSVTTTAMATEMKTKTEPIVTQMVSTNAAELDASVHLSTVTVAAGSVGEILTGIFLIVIVIITTLVIGQQAEVVAIAVGSAGGGLILLITLAVVITMILCYKHKQESYRLTTNVAYTTEINTVTIDNVEFDMTYEAIQEESIKESTSEAQQSSGEASTLSVMQNVAYKTSAIPMSLNVAYLSEQGVKRCGDDEYDYITD